MKNGNCHGLIWTLFIGLLSLFSTFAQGQNPTPNVDLNHDGAVDTLDLLLFAEQWHTGALFTPTPTETQYVSPTPTFTLTPTATETSYATPTPIGPLEEIVIDLPNLPADAIPLTLVRIPAGTFLMGSNDDTSWSPCAGCERPVHSVDIAYDFYIGKYEVTQAQWKSLMGSVPATHAGEGSNYPVYHASWNRCQTFVQLLSSLNQGTFRLPSEAEWEYACRAGTTTRYHFGDSDCYPWWCGAGQLPRYAWFNDNSADYMTNEVGQLLPNAFGLHDMHGNQWEWCQDVWHDDYNGAPADGSAWISPSGEKRAVRSGYSGAPARASRSSQRSGRTPDELNSSDMGLRVVRAIPSASVPTPTPPHPNVTVNIPNLPSGAAPLSMVLVPAGSFVMGSTDDASWSGYYPAEQPVHTVNIASAFYMGKYEVTQAQWQALMGSIPRSDSGVGDDLPVYGMRWNDITQPDGFLDRLNALGQGTFRLPSEAEWEYACRAGSAARYYFGDSDCAPGSWGTCSLAYYAWFDLNNFPAPGYPGGVVKRAGLLLPNAFGLYDMHGNASEWCQDSWHDDYNNAPADGSAWVSDPVEYRVHRGGSFDSQAVACRSADRNRESTVTSHYSMGFRVVREE